MITFFLRLAVVLTALTFAGCGLKGPLYFPSEQQNTQHAPQGDSTTTTSPTQGN